MVATRSVHGQPDIVGIPVFVNHALFPLAALKDAIVLCHRARLEQMPGRIQEGFQPMGHLGIMFSLYPIWGRRPQDMQRGGNGNAAQLILIVIDNRKMYYRFGWNKHRLWNLVIRSWGRAFPIFLPISTYCKGIDLLDMKNVMQICDYAVDGNHVTLFYMMQWVP